MAAVPSDVAFGTAKSIGRYFSIVSFVPSMLLVSWFYLLTASGPPRTAPALGDMGAALLKHSWIGWVDVFGVALAVALITHPLQFAIVQLMEGYWYGTTLGATVLRRNVTRHLQRLNRASARAEAAAKQLATVEKSRIDIRTALLSGGQKERSAVLQLLVEQDAATNLIGNYPPDPAHVMPTRLGNVLRSYEMRVGGSYGLPVLEFATHLGLVAEPSHTAYVQDQRNQLDLAVRLCASSLVAAFGTFALLWPFGYWCLFTLLPDSAAYLCYIGSISAAHAYGDALGAWSDINRFRLYDALGMARPTDTNAEQLQNESLLLLSNGSERYCAEYKSPESSVTVKPLRAGILRVRPRRSRTK